MQWLSEFALLQAWIHKSTLLSSPFGTSEAVVLLREPFLAALADFPDHEDEMRKVHARRYLFLSPLSSFVPDRRYAAMSFRCPLGISDWAPHAV